MSVSTPETQFVIDRVWAAIETTLRHDLGPKVNVDAIGTKDFDEEGMLVLNPPSVRVGFAEAAFKPEENQKLTYWSEQEYFVLCGDEYLGANPQGQRGASLHLASRVCCSLAGARLVLGDGETSDPVDILGVRPMPSASVGIAYAVALKAASFATFPGTNAVPNPPQAGENNG